MKYLVVFTAALTLLQGCASIVSNDQYPVAVQSTPSNVEYEIKNEKGVVIQHGTTPATVSLEASNGYFDGADYTITYRKNGYVTVTEPITSSVDGWYVGNVLFGGVVGLLVVDPLTGAMWKLPNSSNAELVATKNNLEVKSIDALTEDQKSQLVPVKS